MLKTVLIHPEILQALGHNGHGAKILITDGNFPAYTHTPISSVKVFLNLTPGILKVTDVLATLLTSIPLEKAIMMEAPGRENELIQQEFVSILGQNQPLVKLNKADFYAHAESNQNCLTIVTGDTRRYANIILVMGVRAHLVMP